jgi:hypothetical protein
VAVVVAARRTRKRKGVEQARPGGVRETSAATNASGTETVATTAAVVVVAAKARKKSGPTAPTVFGQTATGATEIGVTAGKRATLAVPTTTEEAVGATNEAAAGKTATAAAMTTTGGTATIVAMIATAETEVTAAAAATVVASRLHLRLLLRSGLAWGWIPPNGMPL